MDNIVLIVLSCFIVTYLAVFIVIKIAVHVNALDYPNERKVHKVPMPRLGGLSIFSGFLFGYLFFGNRTDVMNSILIGSFIIILTGMIDDIKPINPLSKLCGQVIAASIVTFYGKILLTNITAFGVNVDFGIFSYILTILFIIGATNCINLIDGLDGLASGISAIFFLTIGIIAVMLNQMNNLDVVLAFIMLGSTLGFLVHNFNPAKIFLGDSGSLFLGYIISVVALLGYKNVTLTSMFVPVLLLAIPILDTFFAIIRRTIKGQSISKPDKFHLHHQLLNKNLSHRSVVLVIYLVDALFSFASIVYVLNNASLGIAIYMILLILVIWLILSTSIIFNKKDVK